MTSFVGLLFALPAVAGLWKRFRACSNRRSKTSLTTLSIGDVARNADEVHSQEVISPRLHYFAAWTDSGFLLGCDHLHGSVISAANCISEAGGYVVAVQSGRLRALNDEEEKLFQMAMYGASLASTRSAVFEVLRIPKSVLN